MDRGAWRVTVHGVANSLARLCTQHTVSFDIIVNLLCQMQHPYNHYLKPSRKALFKRNQPQSVEEEKTWSQGPGNKGLEAGFRGAGMGRGVNLGGGASAFICITNTHRTQYVQFII